MATGGGGALAHAKADKVRSLLASYYVDDNASEAASSSDVLRLAGVGNGRHAIKQRGDPSSTASHVTGYALPSLAGQWPGQPQTVRPLLSPWGEAQNSMAAAFLLPSAAWQHWMPPTLTRMRTCDACSRTRGWATWQTRQGWPDAAGCRTLLQCTQCCWLCACWLRARLAAFATQLSALPRLNPGT